MTPVGLAIGGRRQFGDLSPISIRETTRNLPAKVLDGLLDAAKSNE